MYYKLCVRKVKVAVKFFVFLSFLLIFFRENLLLAVINKKKRINEVGLAVLEICVSFLYYRLGYKLGRCSTIGKFTSNSKDSILYFSFVSLFSESLAVCGVQ